MVAFEGPFNAGYLKRAGQETRSRILHVGHLRNFLFNGIDDTLVGEHHMLWQCSLPLNF